MWARLTSLPLFLSLFAVFSLAMYVPAAHALAQEEFAVARAFFYSGTLFLILIALVALALGGRARLFIPRDQLLTLLGAFVVLPVFLAVPFHEALGTTSFLNAYFEMVSSLTTTGATVFDRPERLADSLHLWRALVGWLGGLLIWVTAIALLAPMNLGGFEVTSTAEPGENLTHLARETRARDAMDRMGRYTRDLAPVYASLTLLLWVGLLIAGEGGFTALCHAMSVMATSGISPNGSISEAGGGFVGEAVVFLFLFFGVTRLVLVRDTGVTLGRGLAVDPEFRLGLIIVVTVPLLLFLRHWVGATEVGEQDDLEAGFRALWGGLFTVLSFLTTTGFVSADWGTSAGWSGLQTPGLILVGLSLVGGGVATTAGGVKLLRVYALYRHGTREIDRLVHPSSVAGKGRNGRRIRQQGAFVAWVFFMLFALSIAAVVMLLAATGVQLDNAIILAVSGLSTTGPLAAVAAEGALSYAGLPTPAKLVLMVAMVLGRLEALAIIALFNPDFWRR